MNACADLPQGAVLLPNQRVVPARRPLCASRHPCRFRWSPHRRTRKVQHDRHRPVGWPQLPLQHRLQASSGSQSAVSADDSIESVIADVLNANRTKIQRPVDLLDVLDSTGNGLQTQVNRSWDTTSVNLSLSGIWNGGAQARKMAMLGVYQERHVRRAALLLQLFRYLNTSRPDLLDSNTVTQLEAAATAAANPLNPAIEVLLVPQLMQMSAGVYPWGVLERVVEGAVQDARGSLFQKPPYTYSSSKRQAAQQQLMYVEATLTRGAAFARLRALLLQQQQQQGDGARKLTLEQGYYESWQQQQQQGWDLQNAADNPSAAAAAAGGMHGKCMSVSFHSRSANAPYALQLSPGLTAAAAAASSSSVAAAAVGGAESGEIQMLCVIISKLTNERRQLQQGLPGGRESTLGVLPEVQRCLRSSLLDLCVTWAESSPAVVLDPLPAAAVAKVAVSSIEHDRLLRRIGLESSGPEVTVLRQLARSKGRGFLAHFSPTVGNPFGNISEWDYFRECPGVWNRFVVDPPTDTATLLLKPGTSWQQQQQQLSSSVSAAAAGIQVQMSQNELQQLTQQLVAVLSNSSSSSSRSNNGSSLISQHSAAAAAAQPGSRQITLQLAAASSSSSVGSDQAGPRLLLLIDGITAAELSSAHVTSLVTVIDDLVVQLPGQYGTTLPDVQVSHAKPLQQLAATAATWISSSSRALAAAALLALPLLAIARPFRGLQHVAPTTAAAAAVVTDVSAAASSSSNVADRQQQQQRLLPMNDHIINAEMQQLCEIVCQQVQGNIWLPAPSSSSSSSSSKGWRIPGFQTVPHTAAAAANTPAAAAMDDLIYQVTADREGCVLGCKPCSSAAAAAYLELPLAAAIQGASLAKVQAKRLATILTADAASPKPAKKAPKASSSKVAQLAAAYMPLPEDGVVVLKLELKPARQPAAEAAAAADQISDDTQQQQQRGTSDHAAVQAPRSDQGPDLRSQSRPGSEIVSKVVGTGRSAVRFILMQPEVSPWRDEDSLISWANTGSVLYQGSDLKAVTNSSGARSDLGVPGQGLGGSESKLGGLALTVDGQKIESIEALVNQLMEKNSAAELQRDAAAADLAGKGQ